jgi:hypothetical protein
MYYVECVLGINWKGKSWDDVFQALIEVIKEHGVGDEGWALARWEVYNVI